MREDIDNSQNRITEKLKVYTNIINEINSRTMECSRVFTRTASKLNKFYEGLFEELKKKQKEQLACIF